MYVLAAADNADPIVVGDLRLNDRGGREDAHALPSEVLRQRAIVTFGDQSGPQFPLGKPLVKAPPHGRSCSRKQEGSFVERKRKLAAKRRSKLRLGKERRSTLAQQVTECSNCRVSARGTICKHDIH